MKYVFDVSYIKQTNRYHSITIYALRFLSFVPSTIIKDSILLVHEDMVDFFTETFPCFKSIIVRYNFLHKTAPKLNTIINYFIYRLKLEKLSFKVVMTFDEYRNETCYHKKGTQKLSVIHDLKGVEYNPSSNSKQYCYYKKLIKSSDKIIAISNFTKSIIHRYFEIEESKVVVVYNSVVLPDHSKKIAGIPSESNYILYVNSLREQKNPLTLLKAFKELKDNCDLNLIFVGSDKPIWNQTMLPYIKENGMEERVIKYQNLSDEEVKFLYENASIFVSTSLYEGFGYTPIEAAICKCPVICTKCAALPDTTRMLLNYYDPPTDERALTLKISDVINSKPDDKTLSDISNFYKDCYSPRKQVDIIIGVMNDMINISSHDYTI